jgi:prepilin-type processing-associated H-X9-DG protein
MTARILPFIDQGPLYSRINFGAAIMDSANFTAAVQQNVDVVRTVLPIQRCPSDDVPAQWDVNVPGGPGTIINPGQATTSYKMNGGSFLDAFNLFASDQRNGMFAIERSTLTAGSGGAVVVHVVKIRDVTDGLTNTVMLGETNFTLMPKSASTNRMAKFYGSENSKDGTAGHQDTIYSTAQAKLNPPLTTADDTRLQSFGSMHAGGGQFLMADGSVRFVSENVQHTGRAFLATDMYDRANGGAGYGLYQRLFSKDDGLPLADF